MKNLLLTVALVLSTPQIFAQGTEECVPAGVRAAKIFLTQISGQDANRFTNFDQPKVTMLSSQASAVDPLGMIKYTINTYAVEFVDKYLKRSWNIYIKDLNTLSGEDCSVLSVSSRAPNK